MKTMNNCAKFFVLAIIFTPTLALGQVANGSLGEDAMGEWKVISKLSGGVVYFPEQTIFDFQPNQFVEIVEDDRKPIAVKWEKGDDFYKGRLFVQSVGDEHAKHALSVRIKILDDAAIFKIGPPGDCGDFRYNDDMVMCVEIITLKRRVPRSDGALPETVHTKE